MIDAVRKSTLSRQEQLHELELPTAQLLAMTANMNKDPKKGKAYSPMDFAIYTPRDRQDLPEGAYGAAALKLVKEKRYPAWALFCFKQLVSSATKDYEPTSAALISDYAILLHPRPVKGGFTGLLIAQERAGNCSSVFVDDQGDEFLLEVPPIPTKVIAEEGVTLMRKATDP